MIRIVALNEELEEDTGSEDEVTREALEEIALQQYAKSLELQKAGKYEEALRFLTDLLDTEVLYEVQKPEIEDNINRPLLHMKYLCFRNIATISERLGKKEDALEAYCEALFLDHTDITIWYKLGKLSLECEKYNLALQSFERGIQVNSKHWPTLDNLVILYLGLGDYNSCIVTIYDALQLDTDYLRGRAYRKYIYDNYRYVMEYLAALDSKYIYNVKEDDDIESEESERLLAQALDINKKFIDQVAKNTFIPILPVLKLEKPIAALTWQSVGYSLVHMHKYMSEKMFSHACVVEIKMKDSSTENIQSPQDNKMDVDESIDVTPLDTSPDESSKTEITDTELLEKEKLETEKTETESDQLQTKEDVEPVKISEIKDKKVPRRRSSLILGMWEWCKTKGKSTKKKPAKQDRDETVYDSLRKLIPDNIMFSENKNDSPETTPEDSMDPEIVTKNSEDTENSNADLNMIDYFGSDNERKDVENYVSKYVNTPADVLTMLNDFLETLAFKWSIPWPNNLGKYFVEAVSCYRQHFETPAPQKRNFDDINLFTHIILCKSEISLDNRMKNENKTDAAVAFKTCYLDELSMYFSRSELFCNDDHLITILRYFWIQAHAQIYNGVTEFALEYLYKMIYELNKFDDGNNFKVAVPNFSSKIHIQKSSITDVIKSLERNEYLSTAMSLYEKGMYDEVKQILLSSYKSCQSLALKGEYSSMSLDWAAQLILLLDTLWSLGHKEECFLWSTKCLSESLKHYMKCLSGSENLVKWSKAVLKALITLEFIIKSEGLYYLSILTEKRLNILTSNLVQIICHQIDESNTSDMPVNTVIPWILLHYIVQIEDDRGRVQKKYFVDDASDVNRDYIPNSFMVLFNAHDYLGKRSWCCNNDGYLLYFILETVLPRIKSPALLPVLETVSQYLEQCVFCLFGHPSKKNKSRYFVDHNVTPFKLDWNRAQQLFDLYNPVELPEFDSLRLASISADTEQLFQRMLSLIPPELDVKPHCENVLFYIDGRKNVIPRSPIVLPFRVRNIYYLLADYYLKTNESSKAIKYFVFDLVFNNDRFNSWAGLALARASLLETKLNSCGNFKSDKEYFSKASAVERCFRKALTIDSSHPMLWIEYGNFVYAVHSFCSRTLKQASESLSMEDFEQLEKRKEAMLDTAEKCFMNANQEFLAEFDDENKDIQDERWLHHYMLGKVAEKKGKSPEEYLNHYMKAAHFLKLNHAEYPVKINYNNPPTLSVEALEIHYRIHASILKYIEQHENKIIYSSEGKVFKEFIDKCAENFSLSKGNGKEIIIESKELTSVLEEKDVKKTTDLIQDSVNSTSDLKRPIINDKEIDQDRKKLKLDSDEAKSAITAIEDTLRGKEISAENSVKKSFTSERGYELNMETSEINVNSEIVTETIKDASPTSNNANNDAVEGNPKTDIRRPSHESVTNTASGDNSSSSSSSDSSSGDSTSDSSSSSSDSNSSKNSLPKPVDVPLSQEQINTIIGLCLDNLEDCVSRFTQHYKALYRLAHYHFYFKRGKNIERCRDLMLGSFIARNGIKLQGLFCERKNTNFFNSVWRIPVSEVDRPGSFASHMSRCVLLIMEILKEIDDHKTLLYLSLQLNRIPEMDKKYLRDSEREELSQQAFSLCVQSLKGQLTKFCHQPDIMSNPVEKNALKSLILDIYRAYQKAQKFGANKVSQFSNLLIEGCKLNGAINSSDNSNLLELSIKYCQSLIMNLKQQAVNPSSIYQTNSVTANPQPKRFTPKIAESSKVTTISASTFLPSSNVGSSFSKTPVTPPVTSYMNYFPSMVDPSFLSVLNTNPTAAATALSYMTGYSGMSTHYQNELMRQLMSTSLANSAYMSSLSSAMPNMSKSKSSAASSRGNAKMKSETYAIKTTMNTSTQKITKPIPNYSTPPYQQTSAKLSKEASISTPHMTATISQSAPSVITSSIGNQIKASFGNSLTQSQTMYSLPKPMVKPAHMTTTCTTNAVLHAKPPLPHQQVSPGKTLQEKLAEKQKHYPTISKTTSLIPSIQDLAGTFSGKIPSALTITKTSGTSLSSQKNEEIVKTMMNKDDEEKKAEPRRSIQFGEMDKSKKVSDSSEVIVLDD